MAVKNYGIFDKWLNIEQQNVVDIQSVDGVIESVKINGEEAGGGGGGSGDFSTAEVTIVNTLEEQIAVILPVLEGNVLKDSTDIGAGETQVLKMPIPTGGGAYITPTFLLGTVSGDIAFEDGLLIITGNGTFTVTGID